MRGMHRLNFCSPRPNQIADQHEDKFSPLRIVGLATVVLGVISLGLYAGRELRFRYKFRHRTPSDFFSNAGDPITGAEYGMGV